MVACSLPRALHLLPSSFSPKTKHHPISQFPDPYQNQIHSSQFPPLSATLNSPKKGFEPKKTKKSKKRKDYKTDDDEEEEDDEEEGVIPEVVTNRMMSRMGFSVGIPLSIGLLFFPCFYYLKVGLKIDVPTWVLFIVSFIFFGTALLGVRYGIVSSSRDPMREEGSLLGWTETKKNGPVFWQSIWSGSGKNCRAKSPRHCGRSINDGERVSTRRISRIELWHRLVPLYFGMRYTTSQSLLHQRPWLLRCSSRFRVGTAGGDEKQRKRISLTARSQYFSVVTAAKASISSWFCAGNYDSSGYGGLW